MNKLKLPKEIYEEKKIKQAINDFSYLCKSTIKENSQYYIISFYQCKNSKEQTAHEMENYIIDLMRVTDD